MMSRLVAVLLGASDMCWMRATYSVPCVAYCVSHCSDDKSPQGPQCVTVKAANRYIEALKRFSHCLLQWIGARLPGFLAGRHGALAFEIHQS